jgi:hypothetical protein
MEEYFHSNFIASYESCKPLWLKDLEGIITPCIQDTNNKEDMLDT